MNEPLPPPLDPPDGAAGEPRAGSDRIEPSPDHVEEALADQTDNVVPERAFDLLPVVGLGGSAGSVQALQTLFESLPADSGMAFVVVIHLAPDRESVLAEVLGRVTTMPVQQVTGSVEVEANHVYVIPPGQAIESLDGHLIVTPLTPDRGRRVAVDLLFRTLADSHGPRASAVVLSGVDGDGAIGLKRIKERGGLTIAQDPDEAEFDGMPRSAIATGMVDWVLRLADMPARLASYHDIQRRLELPPEDGAAPDPAAGRSEGELEAALREVLLYLRSQTGCDFTCYKRATILRRLARRMSVNGIADLPGYLAFMRMHNGEPRALLQDLLISVTNFFRDSEAFDALRAQVPALFAERPPGEPVRVWVAGCASGEEAYSIGMLLLEHARKLDTPPPIQIFATDLDEDAIRIARAGVFPLAITADVSEERLRRFFAKEHGGYRVRNELRELVLFAVHDVLRDSPFSRLDLMSCRNMLIYLKREAQARFFETAHFALRPGGRLFIGVSETTDVRAELFNVIDKKHRVYEPRRVGRLPLPRLGRGQSALTQALELRDSSRRARADPPSVATAAAHAGVAGWSRPLAADHGATSWRDVHLRLIERLSLPSVLVSESYAIVHLSDSAGRFLHFGGGEPATDLLGAVRPELSVDLRTALLRAQESSQPTESLPVPLLVDGDAVSVVMRVGRADDVAAGMLLVTFDLSPAEGGPPAGPAADDEPGRRLARQVDELKWQLREVAELSETTTQELKSSNEELQAMNEELRSATEELETSREELHSINEELTTVNHELKSNVDDLGRANADLKNLMASTAIATVFLDRQLCIRLYTPSAVTLFSLIDSDVGRPLADLAPRLDYPQMGDDAVRVLEALVPIEREVGAGERSFLARCLPYRGDEDRIAGVVFTFMEITVRKAAEDALRESEAQFRTIVSQAAAGVAHLDLEGRLTFVNPRYCEINGYTEAALLGRQVMELVHPADRARDEAVFERLVEHGEPFEIEKRHIRGDGATVWLNAAVTPSLDAAGRATAAIAIVVDITRRKLQEQALRASEERLRLILENAREFAIVGMDLSRRVVIWNRGAEAILGWREDEIVGQSADMIFTAEDRAAGVPEREAATARAEGRAGDERWHQRRDGSRLWGSGVMMAMHDGESSEPIGLLKIFRDQTPVRAAQEALETSRAELVQALVENRRARSEAEAASQAKDRFLAILSHELRTPMTPVVMALHALERSDDLPASARATLDIVRRNVRAELRLIDDLLDITRISSGKLELSTASTDMHQVIRNAADVCEADFAVKRQRLRLVLGAPRFFVPGDGQRLQQVVWNLLKNAAKFTPVDGEIRVETRCTEDAFQFAVSDNGVGIEASALSTIFDEFTQEGPWVTTEFGGLGLGLAIAKATVEAHHGTLTAHSDGRNRGATFTARLPLQ